jgi:hypothetical protein
MEISSLVFTLPLNQISKIGLNLFKGQKYILRIKDPVEIFLKIWIGYSVKSKIKASVQGRH